MSSDGIDWPGLLKWSLQYSDGTAPARQMSEEDAEFLKKAIRIAVDRTNDPCKLVEEAAAKLAESLKTNSVAEARTAMAVIETCIDYPEVARNFHKLGAIDPMLDAVLHSDSLLVEQSLTMLSLTLANNPVPQQAVFAKDGLGHLTTKLNSLLEALKSSAPKPKNREAADDEDWVSDAVLAKLCLGCLGHLVRNVEKIELEFVNKFDGVGLLAKCIATKEAKVQEKAASLLRHLFVEKRVADAQLKKSNFVDVVGLLLGRRDLDDTGTSLGDVSSGMVKAFVDSHKAFIIADGSRKRAMQAACDGRLAYLDAFPLTAGGSDEYAVTRDLVDADREALHAAAAALAAR